MSRWLRSPYAAGPLLGTLAFYAALLVPGALGALLAWPWWITLPLLLPGLLWSVKLGRIGAEQRGIHSRRETPRALYALIGASSVPISALGGQALAQRYWGLALAAMVVAFDLAVRAWWQRYDRRVA
jgi:hypothetical protein